MRKREDGWLLADEERVIPWRERENKRRWGIRERQKQSGERRTENTKRRETERV